MKWILIAGAALVLCFLIIAAIGAMLPKDHLVSRTARFKKTPQQVWDVISGPPTWRPDVRGYEALPAHEAHRSWKEIDGHGKAVAYECLEEQPHSRLVTRIADPNLPYGGTWTYEIVPEPAGSVLTITEAGEVYNPIFRFVSRFIMGHTATIDSYLRNLHDKLSQ